MIPGMVRRAAATRPTPGWQRPPSERAGRERDHDEKAPEKPVSSVRRSAHHHHRPASARLQCHRGGESHAFLRPLTCRPRPKFFDRRQDGRRYRHDRKTRQPQQFPAMKCFIRFHFRQAHRAGQASVELYLHRHITGI